MEIHGENSFRAKSYSVAAYKIEKVATPLSTLNEEQISAIPGIGSAISSKILEILHSGTMQMLEELLEKTPEGILEIMKIKGLGPKKVAVIWKELGIESIGELLYACQENRLSTLSGFGKATQKNVIEAIEFYLSQRGHFLFAKAEPVQEIIQTYFESIFSGRVTVTGEFRRHAEIIETLSFVIECPMDQIRSGLENWEHFEILDANQNFISGQFMGGLNICLYAADKNSFNKKLFETTGSEAFLNGFKEKFPGTISEIEDEKSIFEQAKIQFVPPYLRESAEIIELAKNSEIPEVIEVQDIKGLIHCHSNWSDGVNTLEELAQSCIDNHLEYLVISDHSKAAFYANGLDETRIKAQHQLIDEINQKLKPFKIYKSIECDILNDGSLDYSNSVLSTFDLVIASVHSNLKMTEEKAMERLLTAIENPHTSILGHMTGRLLLSRKGYPIDHQKIIDACAKNRVVIEINANPSRLDMDWRWIQYALEKKVMLSINPDLHSLPELPNLKYGALVAQKGMLTASNNLSSFTLEQMENFVEKNKEKIAGN